MINDEKLFWEEGIKNEMNNKMYMLDKMYMREKIKWIIKCNDISYI